ncbi:hypothetical protein HDU76_005821, partial [Blyttiomyces sp. JEL0837]
HLNDPALIREAEDLLVEWCEVQKDLLIYGKHGDGPGPVDVNRKTGLAYLQGWDTWDDVSKILGKLTQPDCLSLLELKNGEKWFSMLKQRVFRKESPVKEYRGSVAPLLLAIDQKFTPLADRTAEFSKKVPEYLKDLWDDIADSARMTALRAKQIYNLYAFVDSQLDDDKKIGNLAFARAAMRALHDGQEVVARRERRYRAPADRLAGWTGLDGNNPTAYAFNYLWTVRSLHLWWRDAAKVLSSGWSVTSPSFCNIIDPVEVGLGEGKMLQVAETVTEVLSALGVGKNYFDLEEKEPRYPESIKNWKPIF